MVGSRVVMLDRLCIPASPLHFFDRRQSCRVSTSSRVLAGEFFTGTHVVYTPSVLGRDPSKQFAAVTVIKTPVCRYDSGKTPDCPESVDYIEMIVRPPSRHGFELADAIGTTLVTVTETGSLAGNDSSMPASSASSDVSCMTGCSRCGEAS